MAFTNTPFMFINRLSRVHQMVWRKQGLIFEVQHQFSWLSSHAQLPMVYPVDGETLRIYFTGRDTEGRSHPTYIEVDCDNLQQIKHFCSAPILSLGEAGSFDERGVMPSCWVTHQEKLYLYYIGWTVVGDTPYRLSIGLAISDDNGVTFQKHSLNPVLGLSQADPYFVTTPYVLIEDNIWKMWYSSCTGWVEVDHRLEAVYNIKYAQSTDGIHWECAPTPCIDYGFDGEAIARPWVLRSPAGYRMWYSTRGTLNFREPQGQTYRIGYAQSQDGIHWQRQDSHTGISCSDGGWDSEMMAYASLFENREKRYLLYNGNQFGKAGFGYAVWVE